MEVFEGEARAHCEVCDRATFLNGSWCVVGCGHLFHKACVQQGLEAGVDVCVKCGEAVGQMIEFKGRIVTLQNEQGENRYGFEFVTKKERLLDGKKGCEDFSSEIKACLFQCSLIKEDQAKLQTHLGRLAEADAESNMISISALGVTNRFNPVEEIKRGLGNQSTALLMLISCHESCQVLLEKVLQIVAEVYDCVGKNLSSEEGAQIITATKPAIGDLLGVHGKILEKGSKIVREVERSNSLVARLAATMEVELEDEQRRRRSSSAVELPRPLICVDDVLTMVRKMGASFSFFKSSSASKAEALVRQLIKGEEINAYTPVDEMIRAGGRLASLNSIPISSHLINEFTSIDDVAESVDDMTNEIRVLKECFRVLAFWLETEVTARKAYQDRLFDLRCWFKDDFLPGWREILLCMEITHADCRSDKKRMEDVVNESLVTLSDLPMKIISFEKKQSTVKPSVLADEGSKLAMSEAKNDLYAFVFDKLIKFLAPPAACAIMAPMVEVDDGVETVDVKPHAVVAPMPRRGGHNTRRGRGGRNHQSVDHRGQDLLYRGQQQVNGRGGGRGNQSRGGNAPQRGRGGQQRGNRGGNSGGRGGAKSRSPLRSNDHRHRFGEHDGVRRKIQNNYATRSRSYHSNAGINVEDEASTSGEVSRSESVVTTTNILSGVEEARVFSDDENLAARRQFFSDVSAKTTRARRVMDALGIDIGDKRPLDGMIEIADGTRPKWRVVVDDVRRQIDDERAGIDDYEIMPTDMKRFEDEINRWRVWASSPEVQRKMEALKEAERRKSLQAEEEEHQRSVAAAETLVKTLHGIHPPSLASSISEDDDENVDVDEGVGADAEEASFVIVKEDVGEEEEEEDPSAAVTEDDEDAVNEQMSVEIDDESMDESSVPSLISTAESATPTRIFMSNGLAARRILRRDQSSTDEVKDVEWPPANSTPSAHRRMQALGVDHPRPEVQAPLIRELADRVGEMALHVGGIRRPAETYHAASARMGMKGLDEFRRNFERKALHKVEELSQLDPIKKFEDQTLERVEVNRRRAEQRSEFILRKIKRRERADQTEPEKFELYCSESDDSDE